MIRNFALACVVAAACLANAAADTVVDEERIERVLFHLLENARKFSAEGTEIEVRVALETDTVVVEVADRGKGVDESEKDRMFERFWQGGDLLTDKPEGTGLGLPICAAVMAAIDCGESCGLELAPVALGSASSSR